MTSVRQPYYKTYAEEYQKRCCDNTGNSVIAEFGRAPLDYDFVYDCNWHENEDADAFIILAANGLRPGYHVPYDKWFHLLEHSDKPIHVIGLGAQANLEAMNPREYVKTLAPEMVRWVHLLAERCHTIGTRGEFTADVIKALGVSNVEPVGCPTWYVNGWDQPEIVKKEWSKHLKPGFFTCWEPYSDWHVAWHRALLDNALQLTDPKFIIQSEFNFIPYMLDYKDPAQLFAHLTPEDFRKSAEAIQKHFGLTPYEVYGNEKLKNMFEVFTDISDWSDFVRTRDFNFGFRIHGSIIALKNGVPAFCVVSDSRMYEMCELYHIPYICVNQIASSDFNLEKIYNEADYSEMNKKYEQHLRNYISFLDKNGISHTFTRK